MLLFSGHWSNVFPDFQTEPATSLKIGGGGGGGKCDGHNLNGLSRDKVSVKSGGEGVSSPCSSIALRIV